MERYCRVDTEIKAGNQLLTAHYMVAFVAGDQVRASNPHFSRTDPSEAALIVMRRFPAIAGKQHTVIFLALLQSG